MANEITNMTIINFFIESYRSLIATKATPNKLHQLYNINLSCFIQYPIGNQIKQIQLILDDRRYMILGNICTIRQCVKSRESGENISYFM